MHSERGQASVEWIVLVLLLTLALTALARFAFRADAGDLGAELLSAVTCAADGRCDARRDSRAPGDAAAPAELPPRSGGTPGSGAPTRLVTAPPLLPLAPRARGVARPGGVGLDSRRPPAARAPAARPPATPPRWLRPPRFGPLVRRAGRGAGVLWRRSWIMCLGYERVRYSVLHPEIRFPNATMPMSEGVRIANDCLSPADVIRDFGPPSKP